MSTSNPARRLLVLAVTASIVAAGVLAILAASAGAKSNTIALRTAKVAGHSERVAVNAAGLTVYTLSGDSRRHMKCRRGNGCFSFWPPVTVKHRPTKAAGVKGRLGTFKRDGFTQVTLNGHPLYTYAGDERRPGLANGNGIRTFGGTWHVVPAASGMGSWQR